MNLILIGNALSLVGAVVMLCIGFIRKKEHVLLAQCVQCSFMGMGNLALGGVTGMITCLATVLRNLVSFKLAFTLPYKLAFCLFQILFCLFINQEGLIGWLPVLAACVFTFYLDTDSDFVMKVVCFVTLIMWLIYDMQHQNLASSVFDVLCLCSNAYGAYMIWKEEKKMVPQVA